MPSRPLVYVVDDDPGVRATLAAVLETAEFWVQAFASGLELLEAPLVRERACMLVDLYLPDMTGLALQEALKDRGHQLPLIMMTGHADVSMAVQAMKNGAFDFIEKPFQPEALLEVVSRALGSSPVENAADARSATPLVHQLKMLTGRERIILKAALSGASSKAIARQLSISPRTVDVHRGNVLKKLGIKSTLDISRLLSCDDLDRLLASGGA